MSMFYNPFIMLSVLLKAGYYRAHTKKRVNGCATSHENQDKTEHFCCSLNPPPSNLCLVNSYRRLILVTPTQSFVSVKVRGWGGRRATAAHNSRWRLSNAWPATTLMLQMMEFSREDKEMKQGHQTCPE